MQTKDEMQDELDQLKQAYTELESSHQKNIDELKVIKAESDGWLITTPNPLFSGMSRGVQFKNGQAFIPITADYPEMRAKATKITTLEKLPPLERKQIRDREKTPTSELLVEELGKDMGYKVDFFGDENRDELREALNRRALEATQAQMALDTAVRSKSMITPRGL